MDETVRDRLLLYIKHLDMSVNSFEKHLGFSSSSISKYLRGDQQSIGIEKVEHILSKDNSLSAEWLLRGKGEMFNNTAYQTELHKLLDVAEPIDLYSPVENLEGIMKEFSDKLVTAINSINKRVSDIESKIKNP